MKNFKFALLIAAMSMTMQTSTAHSIHSFVENADEMIGELLNSNTNDFATTRSFVVGEEKTRAIEVRKKNKAGEAQTVVVQVPESGVDPAARLKVEFDVNSATLRPSAYPLLAELGKALKDERVVEHQVCIKGHTDSDGEAEYNLKLSFDRAESVLKYLKAAVGISPNNLHVFGYGENMPLNDNQSAAAKQLNRRVEVSLNCAEID